VLSRWRPLGRGLLASLMVYPVGALIRRRRGTGADLGRESQFCVGVCFFDRLLTRPTDQPRHATQTSSQQSKPLRPLDGCRRDPGVSTPAKIARSRRITIMDGVQEAKSPNSWASWRETGLPTWTCAREDFRPVQVPDKLRSSLRGGF
jgi:hypothetical protein